MPRCATITTASGACRIMTTRAVRAADTGRRPGRACPGGRSWRGGTSTAAPTMASTSSASPACATPALEKLLTSSGIIRNRLKVWSVRDNARTALDVIAEHGSLDAYLWSFVGGRPMVNRWQESKQVPATTDAVGPDEQGTGQTGFPLCRLDHMLCVHAGDRDGERPSGLLLQIRGVRSCRTLKKSGVWSMPSKDDFEALSDRVWGMPELCYGEFRSCAEHTAMLRAAGLPRNHQRRRHPHRRDGRIRRRRPGDRHPRRIRRAARPEPGGRRGRTEAAARRWLWPWLRPQPAGLGVDAGGRPR